MVCVRRLGAGRFCTEKDIVASQLRKGTRMGKYRLDCRIGQGAFAEVWKARDTVESRPVALKVTRPEAVAEWGRSAIEHEARIASHLDHQGIVAVRNADWIDDRFVIASDLAVSNLAMYPKARRSGAVAMSVIREITAGLAHAHSQRVLHRDVKPENILVFADGHAALGDFGASRFSVGATRTVTEAGTLGYMAPEQAYGRARFASDVFSLGLIAYEIVTGVLPTWPFTWPPEGYARFRERVPEPVRRVLRKAAQFDPRRRYPDAVALHKALEGALARVESEPRRRNAKRRRKPARAPAPLSVHSEAFRRVHGKELGLRVACYRCEGPISEAMRVCPWCGASDNSFRKVTSYPLVCPECERGVRREWNACPWCYRGRFVGNGRKPPPDPQAVRRCGGRGCSGELRPFMRFWSHPDLPDRCPRCRWPTSNAFMRFCPWCGRREPRAGAYRRAKRH
jgi:serine/threonine-protein kinase